MDNEIEYLVILKDILPILKEIVLLVFGAIGSYVAWQGLNTWKRQLKGKDEYELCKKVLVDLYKYKNGIKIVRNPAMFQYEYENKSSDENYHFKNKEQKFKDISYAYQQRWNKIQENRDKLNLSLMESKVYWDDKLEILFTPIFEFESKLFNSVQEYLLLNNPYSNEDYKKIVGKIFHQENKNEILYFLGTEDKYNMALEKNIKEIENFIRMKIKK